MPLRNTKLYIELKWTKHSIVSTANTATTFQIKKTELYVPVVTLNTESNKKLSDLLKKSFKRSVIWNEYKSKIQTVSTIAAKGVNTDTKRILFNASYQEVNRLFVMGYDTNTVKRNSDDSQPHQRYF